MQGLFLCSPWSPIVVIATQLAIQAFIKSLCDLHGVLYRPYLREQFSIAYNLYLEICHQTNACVNAALGRDTPNWWLKHPFPACMYKLEGEDALIFSFLTTMDSKNSLKRVLRRAKTDGSEQEPTLGPLKEWEDSQDGGEDYFLMREQMNKWAKGRVNSPCSDCWKNMINNISRAKYPLAIVEVLSDVFGLKIGSGYDIGCHFGTPLSHSELGDKAFVRMTTSFHGHAHNRLYQLSFLATYVEGMGLEDLEGCEHYFSHSNGKFICDNYQQTFKILQTEPGLKRWMAEEGIDDYDTFHVWLEEEKDYLLGPDAGLPKKREETLEMEYVKKLVARRHAIEQRNWDLEVVLDLEVKMGIEPWWTSSDAEWIAAATAIKNHKYQGALDAIEKIIVERLLEMTKIHQSGTGYKMWSHIAKALQSRSKGVRNTIERYNAVALNMDPPMPTCSWDEVVNYGFLSEFDLLCNTRDSVQSQPWTRRNYRFAMDSYCMILHACKEIKRLNIEMKRVVTWIDNEDLFFQKKEEEYKESNPALAFQISVYCQQRAHSDTNHMHRLWALAKSLSFIGSVEPGASIEMIDSSKHKLESGRREMRGRTLREKQCLH
ncbi:hypothetical protein DFH08DRAFT_917231 [Mycena albidolilacea]|uniref:Uncharacterized protein n=1 Tax=Mycena albidolilacea TaxID=1033008 RepID=A0AAD6ZHE6_9AGAR|nr:hypothetical protein DFH08DRAFT_917231 [Mycena albidolilacea]